MRSTKEWGFTMLTLSSLGDLFRFFVGMFIGVLASILSVVWQSMVNLAVLGGLLSFPLLFSWAYFRGPVFPTILGFTFLILFIHAIGHSLGLYDFVKDAWSRFQMRFY